MWNCKTSLEYLVHSRALKLELVLPIFEFERYTVLGIFVYLFSGVFVRDPKEVFDFICQLIAQAKRKCKSSLIAYNL